MAFPLWLWGEKEKEEEEGEEEEEELLIETRPPTPHCNEARRNIWMVIRIRHAYVMAAQSLSRGEVYEAKHFQSP